MSFTDLPESFVIVHPLKATKSSGWTYTHLRNSVATARDGDFTKDEAVDRATKAVKLLWPSATISVQDTPYVSEAKKAAGKRLAASNAKPVPPEVPAEDEPRKRSKPGEAKAAVKASESETHYPGRKCAECSGPIERTGKRGRPPAYCNGCKAKGVVPAAPRVSVAKGQSSKPCVCCGGVVKTTGRGRPSAYCSKIKCQKAKDKAKSTKPVVKAPGTAPKAPAKRRKVTPPATAPQTVTEAPTAVSEDVPMPVATKVRKRRERVAV